MDIAVETDRAVIKRAGINRARIVCGLVLCLLAPATVAPATLAADAPAVRPLPAHPLIVAHRGASGYLPEHTREAYIAAIDMGADFLEIDLVLTKDGHLIARHENEISSSTDVAARYPGRKTKKTIDGKEEEGWFSEDFTLEEIRTLRAKQLLAIRDQSNNGKFLVASLDDILKLRADKLRETGRTIGLYLEPKQPAYYRSINRPLEPILISALKAQALARADSRVILHSYDAESVKLMSQLTAGPVSQLLSDQSQTTDESLAQIARYAKSIGAQKRWIVPVDANGQTQAPTDLIQRAHKMGLRVHANVFAPESQFLPASYRGDQAKEYCLFQSLGVDGVFTDTPDEAFKAFRESCPIPALNK